MCISSTRDCRNVSTVHDPKKKQTGPYSKKVTVRDTGKNLIYTVSKDGYKGARFDHLDCTPRVNRNDKNGSGGCSSGKCSWGRRFSNGVGNFFCGLGKGLMAGITGIGKGIAGILGGGLKLAGGLCSGLGAGLSSINMGGGFGVGMGMGFNPMMMGGFPMMIGCNTYGGLMGGFPMMMGCNPFHGLFGGCGSSINISLARPTFAPPPPMMFTGCRPHGFRHHC